MLHTRLSTPVLLLELSPLVFEFDFVSTVSVVLIHEKLQSTSKYTDQCICAHADLSLLFLHVPVRVPKT